MRLLIPTQSGDVHAKVVQRVLTARGHDVTLWYTSDLPQRGTATLELGVDRAFHPVLTGPNGVVEGPFDVFWLRRPTQAVLPDGVHPADRHFVETEWLAFQRGLKSVVAPNAFWVNPFDAAYRAERKAVQLATAAQVGLQVPPTLMSNDPARIRDFIRRQPGETIYKPFRMVSWDGQETSALTYTSVISEADLDDEEVVQWTPGIFQPRIDKSHELRVTIMGETMFVSRLESQAHADGKVDWRGGALPAERAARVASAPGRGIVARPRGAARARVRVRGLHRHPQRRPRVPRDQPARPVLVARDARPRPARPGRVLLPARSGTPRSWVAPLRRLGAPLRRVRRGRGHRTRRGPRAHADPVRDSRAGVGGVTEIPSFDWPGIPPVLAREALMKKQQKKTQRRVLGRRMARELTKAELERLTGGCGGTCSTTCDCDQDAL